MLRPAEPSLPLSMAGVGIPHQLVSIRGGERRAQRLTELGLTPGVTLRVMQDSGSALLIAVGDSRLALDRGLAQSVVVAPLERTNAHG